MNASKVSTTYINTVKHIHIWSGGKICLYPYQKGITEKVGPSDNVSDMYSGGVGFECKLGLYRQRLFCVFLRSL
jgi:hypothetical protein